MKRRPTGLGRGLAALIPPKSGGTFSSGDLSQPKDNNSTSKKGTYEPEAPKPRGIYREVSIVEITANPQQPRRHFDHSALEDLVVSIQERGIIQPLVVTQLSNGTYELIAGERRLRAARIAGLETVPCIVRTATEQDKLEIALIENIQRHDLNSIEEAIAYNRLIEEFGMTQDEVGQKVGKSRPRVANTVRLLQLPEDVQQALIDRKINASNARTLLSLSSDEERMDLFRAMLAGNFTVRQTEARVPHPRRVKEVDPNVLEHERKFREALGHRVDVKPGRSGGGEIRIFFHSDDDLNDLASRILGK